MCYIHNSTRLQAAGFSVQIYIISSFKDRVLSGMYIHIYIYIYILEAEERPTVGRLKVCDKNRTKECVTDIYHIWEMRNAYKSLVGKPDT